MNTCKEQTIEMQLQRIAWYSNYVDLFTRIIQEIIENGEPNLKPSDLPNLINLTTKYTRRLRTQILHLETNWEFYN